MAHHKQALIDRILDEDAEAQDHSLRKKALDRALGNKVPRTLTPWEWEEYYAEHGVPDAHRIEEKPESNSRQGRPWWKRLFARRAADK